MAIFYGLLWAKGENISLSIYSVWLYGNYYDCRNYVDEIIEIII